MGSAKGVDALRRKWEAITDVPERPRSVMNVVEYGLGHQRRAEVYVNRLLRYFLDSSEPHGLGTDFLRAFLEGLTTGCEFQEDLYDLLDVEVGEQVSAKKRSTEGDTKRQGWLDLLIQVPREWFLIVELKFAAAETGTEFYCNADTIDGIEKCEYESGGYYLYLHRTDKPEASGDCFANWTWRDFLDTIISPFSPSVARCTRNGRRISSANSDTTSSKLQVCPNMSSPRNRRRNCLSTTTR